MNITFTGMSGTGKSVVGKRLAERRGYSFIDLDDRIESEHGGKPLRFLLRDLGDDGFVRMESGIVRSLVGMQDTVVATGGSVVYSSEAMQHLMDISTVFYLYSPPHDIVARRGGSVDHRGEKVDMTGIVGLSAKMLSVPISTALEQLQAERTELYERYSHVRIDRTGLELEQTVDKVERHLSELRRA